MITVTARDGKEGRAVQADINIGENLEDAINLVGEDVLYSNYKQKAVIAAQAKMRGMIRSEKTDEEIAEAMAAWHPGVAASRSGGKSLVEKATAAFEKMNEDEKQAYLEKIRAALQS